MNAVAYWVCTVQVAIPSLFQAIGFLLGLVQVRMPFSPWLTVFNMFGSLVPSMVAFLVPYLLHVLLWFVLVALVFRRAWLFFARGERVPPEFAGFSRVLGLIAFWSIALGALTLLASLLLRGGSGVPAAMLMIPAAICLPWAFFLTELKSLRRTRAVVAG